MRRVSKAICELSPKYIVWPIGNKIPEVALGFSQISGFPDIIGAIDATHFIIPPPKDNAEAFLNREGRHSIHLQVISILLSSHDWFSIIYYKFLLVVLMFIKGIIKLLINKKVKVKLYIAFLQAVCDHTGSFTNIYVGNEGSITDERAFHLSPLQEYINDPEKFPNNMHLIGDIGYKLHQRLLTPYFNYVQLTGREKNYNSCHLASRVIINRTLAHLKCRWKSLQQVLGITQMDYISCHILTCCVLHNICLLKEDILEELTNEELELQDEDVIAEEANLSDEEVENDDKDIAEAKRNLICNNLHMS